MSVRILILALCLLFSNAALAGEASVLQQARELLSQGEGQAAYDLLLAHEGALAGEPAYDLLLARSALLSGQANVALFILERVVFAYPQFYPARLLMATAYARLEAYPQAREILEAMLAEGDLDEGSRQQATRLLAEIRGHTRGYRISAYISLGTGNDTNANAATASTRFLGYDLSANSIATPSASTTVALGVSASHDLGTRSKLFTAVDWSLNQYPQAGFVNNEVLGFQLGWQGEDRYVLAYQTQTVTVDKALNNRGNHLFGMLNTHTRMRWQPFLRLGEVRYTDTLSIKDVQQAIIGIQFSLPDWIRNSRVSILLAEDLAIEAGSPYGRDYAGLQFRKESRYLSRMRVAYKAGYIHSRYNGLFYGSQRDEGQTSLGVEVHYLAAGRWDFSLAADYIDTASTIALYDYNRFIIGLNFKRQFVR